MGNLDSILSQLVERVEQGISNANDAAADAPISRGESVAVTFYTQGDATVLADFLRANGGDPRNIDESSVEAYVPISLLVRASEYPGVVRVDTIVPPQSADVAPFSLDSRAAPSKGNVTSQGVALHGADAWHAAGYTGAGVKVGIIDGGFAGFSALMGSELPANVIARCYTAIRVFSSNRADCEVGNNNHGTVVAETLLDIAPDVTLYISNPPTILDLKSAVDWMVSQDVDVINHSVSWLWDGPGNGTSPSRYINSPLKSVNATVNGGAMWTNSAGNNARRTWYGQYVDSDSDGWLDFAGIDELNKLEMAQGTGINIQLRWEDSWINADTDLDLYLYRDLGSENIELADKSERVQVGASGNVPSELISGVSRSGGTYGIAIRGVSGIAPSWVQVQVQVVSGGVNLEYYTESGSMGNPAESANPGMLAVGASPWWDVNAIAPYSSRGPTPDGRTKPDITGVDCAEVAGLRATNLSNGQRCWFFGTSQASPHVAGLAALVKDAFPNYTPVQMAQYLKENAQVRGAVPNNDWGYGFAMLPVPPQTAATPTPTRVPGVAPVPTAVNGDIANRVSVLEQQQGLLQQQTGLLQQLMQNLQLLIQALTNRVTVLEQSGGAAPVATPTATPTATPSPTPTRVSQPRPAPTAVSGDTCIQPIQPGTTNGAWTTACVTANAPDNNTYYAKFYTFTLATRSNVSITLSAANSTYLYLLSGAGTGGNIAHQAGATPSPTNTLTATLQPGSYTIEATTYNPNVTGDFTLQLAITP